MSTNLVAITMPKWGLSMKEGSILKWIKSNGDNISKGDMILEIETEKVVNEMESPEDGKILKICANEGDTVPVGSIIAVCGKQDASNEEVDAFIEEFNSNFKADINLEEDEEDLNEKIKVSDLEINFIKNINSNNENILFIHGFGGDLNNWMFNQNELSEKFNTYAIDLPGHGMSEKNIHSSTLDDLANLISSFCIANDINSVNLVGHSFGAGISIKTASLYPDLINSLTLISPIGLGKEIDSAYLENFINAESRRDLKKEIEKLYFNSDIITRDMLNEVLKSLRIDNVQSTLSKIQNEIIINGEQKNNLIDEINSTKVPVCVVWGKEDQIIPSNHHQVLNDRIKIIIEKDCGHMAHIEKPSVVNDAINSTIVGLSLIHI